MLTLADIPHVVEELCPVTDKWHSIGIQIGLSERDLKSIETYYPRPVDRLREVISKWVSGGQATWGTVTEALKSARVSELHLAETLKLKHLGSDLARAPIDTTKKTESKLNHFFVVFVGIIIIHVHACVRTYVRVRVRVNVCQNHTYTLFCVVPTSSSLLIHGEWRAFALSPLLIRLPEMAIYRYSDQVSVL